jgi:thioredoxin-like negative regulator of GroEL
MARALEAHPDNPNVLYNLACCEALAGRREDALAHLARAVEGDPRMREWAANDSDLDSIRDEL